jgi:hypothetical protein
MKRTFCALLLTSTLSAATLLAQAPATPPLERGFHADSSFQMGDIDNIDLFRGSLELVIPIGNSYPVGGNLSYQLKLAYHSDV